MSGTCAKCELPTSNGRRLCRDCSREEYFDGLPAQVAVEPDHTPGRYGVPRSAASFLLDRIQTVPWNPDAELRLMIGDLRGDWPEEWMLQDQAGFQSARQIRADGSGWGTLVDRDGDPIESRPDLAGEHRDTTRPLKGKSRINGHQLNSKWSEVRQAVIAADEDLPTSEVADRADVSTSAARNWLGKAHDAGHIRPTRTITRPRNEFDEWAIADVGADDLPEVLLSE